MIMRNLVENAIKFNDKEIIKISISVKKAAQELEISIYDNGRGIPAEDQGKVFEKFYQIEKFFTGNVEGAGLGLALVKRLVSAYGGQIDLKSEIGKGATFTVTVPA
jgi:signal transduction histidine kinase